MKEIAKKLDCLVFVLSQSSRDGGSDGSTPVSLQSARDTGAIEETGDYVLGVYRPAVASNLSNDERLAIQNEYYRSEEHTSELQSRFDLVCRLLLENKNIRL